MPKTKRSTASDIWANIHRRRGADLTRRGQDGQATASVDVNLGNCELASAEVAVMEREPGVYLFAAWRRTSSTFPEKIAEWTVTAPHRVDAAAEVTP